MLPARKIGHGNMMKISAKFLLFLLFFFIITNLYADSNKTKPHGDKSNLPKGCASCHKGHGEYNTPMLHESRKLFCFRCHGHSQNIEKTKKTGDLAMDIQEKDLQGEFDKAYHHPIEKDSVHHFGETLPEVDPSLPRHVTCADCHHHHYVSNDNKTAGIKGTNRQGMKTETVNVQYELCFNCHSYSANLLADQTNKAELFDAANPSFHPVVSSGKNSDVPSLIYPLTTSSLIKCTDCHNNDDPLGPKGPHGSKYEHILSKHFNISDGPEGISEYELCYSCHNRNSILGNESFPFHDLHIVISNISCRTCHNPHGSTQNAHLIDLDNISIWPSKSGQRGFTDFGPRAGECYLNCHGKDHDPAVYPSKPSTSSKTGTPSSSRHPSHR